jgi:hypothetical protein
MFISDVQTGCAPVYHGLCIGPTQEVVLVLVDFNHCPASCTFDATRTAVVDGALARVMN